MDIDARESIAQETIEQQVSKKKAALLDVIALSPDAMVTGSLAELLQEGVNFNDAIAQAGDIDALVNTKLFTPEQAGQIPVLEYKHGNTLELQAAVNTFSADQLERAIPTVFEGKQLLLMNIDDIAGKTLADAQLIGSSPTYLRIKRLEYDKKIQRLRRMVHSTALGKTLPEIKNAVENFLQGIS